MLHTNFGQDRQSNTLEAVYMTDHNEHGVRAIDHRDHSRELKNLTIGRSTYCL